MMAEGEGLAKQLTHKTVERRIETGTLPMHRERERERGGTKPGQSETATGQRGDVRTVNSNKITLPRGRYV